MDIQVRVGNVRPLTGRPPDRTGNTLCTTIGSLRAGTTTVWCTAASTGVYLSIQLMGAASKLSLCEVQVLGAESGKQGFERQDKKD